ncbi:hypothetical protein BDV11DRAFT_60521 [Aspergillus similis]
MAFADILLLAALQVATIAPAQIHRLSLGMHLEAIGELVPRRLFDNASETLSATFAGSASGSVTSCATSLAASTPTTASNAARAEYVSVDTV